MPLPMPRPMSGKRFAPKIRIMMNRMTSSSGIPRRGSMVTPSGVSVPNSITEPGPAALAAGVVVAALVLGAWTVHAQFTSSVNVVEVYASVTDRQGQPVKGLSREDFTLREDGAL